jgi:hypothetical protein
MRRVLFVASGVSYFREMAPVIWHFAATGWEVRVLFGSTSPITRGSVAECRAHGIRADVAPSSVGYGSDDGPDDAAAMSAHAPQPPSPPASKSRPTQWNLVRRAGRWARLTRFINLRSDFVRMQHIRRYTETFVREADPDVVFQGAYHSVGEIDNGIACACDRRNIPRYCLPNSGYVGGRIMTVARAVHIKTGMASTALLTDHDWVNRMFAWLFPSWPSRIADGRYAFPWDPVYMFVAWINRLFFDRVWMKPAVDFKRVFVFSDYSADLLRADGYPMDKVVVSGEPLLDDVWRRVGDAEGQRKLYDYLKLAPGTPFLLVNIEPAAEHSYCDWDRHWAFFHELMNAVVGHGMPVVLSLHPLCDAARYDFVEQKYGVFICRDVKIHELYPFCGLSISFPCSTNLLASIFKKSLVIYDFFRLTDADPDSTFVHALPGAHIAADGAALAAIVTELATAAFRQRVQIAAPDRLACDTVTNTVAADLAIHSSSDGSAECAGVGMPAAPTPPQAWRRAGPA